MASARRTRKTVYVVAGFYVMIGLFLSVGAAVAGDRLSTFLGFLIITGALAAAVFFNAILRLGSRLHALGESLYELHHRMGRIEKQFSTSPPAKPLSEQTSPTQVIDLAAVGSEDITDLTAAVLDRDVFPRLVDVMDEHSTKQTGSPPGKEPRPRAYDTETTPTATPSHSVNIATRNLLWEWKVAMREEDLATCRRVLSALVDTAEPELLARLQSSLRRLADRTEASLRFAFTQAVQHRDYRTALTVGQQVADLLPDRRVARDFEQIKPYLRRRVEQQLVDSSPSRREVSSGFAEPVQGRVGPRSRPEGQYTRVSREPG